MSTEETKPCGSCGEDKPLSEFRKLRKDREWLRSDCAECHNAKTRANYAVRRSLLIILYLFIYTSALSQDFIKDRKSIVDSINYYRADPVGRVGEVFGIVLSSRYVAKRPYSYDSKLAKAAQKWAVKMSRTGKYQHSGNRQYSESIDRVGDRQGGSELSVARFIIDEYVKGKGHRRHLLMCDDDLIGVGVSKDELGRTYVCVMTSSSSPQ